MEIGEEGEEAGSILMSVKNYYQNPVQKRWFLTSITIFLLSSERTNCEKATSCKKDK